MTERLVLMAGGTCGSAASPVSGRLSSLTTSFGIVHNDIGIIVDNGYGIQNVAKWLMSAGVSEIVMLQTHYHLDHVAGLPLNSLLFQRKIPIIGIWSARPSHMDATVAHMFNELHWPVRPEIFGIEMPKSRDARHDLPEYIKMFELNHPGGSLAYRISHPRGDIVIATDHEAGSGISVDQQYADFVSGAAVLVSDIQYRQAEYDGKAGISGGPAMNRREWGHSTPEQISAALALSDETPKQVLVTHHDPMRSQTALSVFGFEIEEALGPVCGDVRMIYDGEEIAI